MRVDCRDSRQWREPRGTGYRFYPQGWWAWADPHQRRRHHQHSHPTSRNQFNHSQPTRMERPRRNDRGGGARSQPQGRASGRLWMI